MKQKIVIKVCTLPCDRCRTKALEVVAKAHGLISVAITGDEKLEVVGDGVDPVCLVRCLRKKICYAEILQVEEVKDKKKEEKQPEVPKPGVVHTASTSCPGYCYCHPLPLPLPLPLPPIVCHYEDSNSCAIM